LSDVHTIFRALYRIAFAPISSFRFADIFSLFLKLSFLGRNTDGNKAHNSQAKEKQAYKFVGDKEEKQI
jgi:hypothetical protein